MRAHNRTLVHTDTNGQQLRTVLADGNRMIAQVNRTERPGLPRSRGTLAICLHRAVDKEPSPGERRTMIVSTQLGPSGSVPRNAVGKLGVGEREHVCRV